MALNFILIVSIFPSILAYTYKQAYNLILRVRLKDKDRICYVICQRGKVVIAMMIYTEEVRKKLDAILKAFESYIDGQDYFDVVYSKKAGYLWIVVDDPGSQAPEQISQPEDLLDNLFNDIINDVVAPRESTSLTEGHALTESEEMECRRKIAAILETIKDGADEYLDYLDSYLKDYQERCHEDGE